MPFYFLFFSIIRPTPRSTLFPYTTLFRSVQDGGDEGGDAVGLAEDVHALQALVAQPAFHAAEEAAGHVHVRSEEHTSELQSQSNLVCRLLLEKKNGTIKAV